MAMSGMFSGCPTDLLQCPSVSVSTYGQVVSAPVPLVVGMAINRAFWRSPRLPIGATSHGVISGRS